MSKNRPRPEVRRFKRSNTTPIPNDVLDWLPGELNGGEQKVMVYLCRRTFGFHRDYEAVSFQQLAKGLWINGRQVDTGAGLSERAAKTAVKALEDKGLIWVGRYTDSITGHVANQYAVLVEEDTLGDDVEDTTPLVQNLHKGVVQNLHKGLVQNLHKPNKERKKGFRNKAPYSPPRESKATQTPAPCPYGQCNGTGLLSGDGTVSAILSGQATLCLCDMGRQNLAWAKGMAS